MIEKAKLVSFPKVFNVGTVNTPSIEQLDNSEVTEKIDGSQFSFAVTEDKELFCRSKNVMITYDAANNLEVIPDLFRPTVNYLLDTIDLIPVNIQFFGEALKSNKHNSITYDRCPESHFLAFYAIDMMLQVDYSAVDLKRWHNNKSILFDVIPIIYSGTKMLTYKDVEKFLEVPSALGGESEGVVIKCYKPWSYGGRNFPLICLKYVKESFREKNKKEWRPRSGKIEDFMNSLVDHNRWEKALQHLKEADVLTKQPKDIGNLVQEVQQDLLEECEDDLKESIYQIYRKDITKAAVRGLPQWYKTKLLRGEV